MSLWGPPVFKTIQNQARKHGFEMEDRYVDLASVCTLPSGLTKYKSERRSSHLTHNYRLFSIQPYSVIHDTITYMWHFNFSQSFILHKSSTHRKISITNSSQTSFGKAFSLKIGPINTSIWFCSLVLSVKDACLYRHRKPGKVLETNTLHSSLQDVLCFRNQKMI